MDANFYIKKIFGKNYGSWDTSKIMLNYPSESIHICSSKKSGSRMTENVMIEVGQCGNQIGRRFWELALVEHAKAKTDPNYDLALSTFFRNVDSRSGRELKVG